MKRTPRRPGRFRRRRAGECPTRLAEGLARVLSRRVDDVTRRAGDLSEKDFSLAVADISRLVMAAARLGKLEEAGARKKDERPIGVQIEEGLSQIMYGNRAPADGGGSKAPDFGELSRAAAGGGGDRG